MRVKDLKELLNEIDDELMFVEIVVPDRKYYDEVQMTRVESRLELRLNGSPHFRAALF